MMTQTQIAFPEPKGKTYEPTIDGARLAAQQLRVFEAMKDGQWRTLREIAAITKDPEASISARLRDMNHVDGWRMYRRRRTETGGTHEYRILTIE